MRTRNLRWWLLLVTLLAGAVYVLAPESERAVLPEGAVPSDEADGREPARLRGAADFPPTGPDPAASGPGSVPIVRGVVVDARTGKGVGGVPVLVCSPREWWERASKQAVRLRTVSGVDGAFSVADDPVALDESWIYVFPWGAGWVPAPGDDRPAWQGDSDWLVSRRAGVTDPLRFEVVPSPRVEGRVLLFDGGPASGAEVRPAIARTAGPSSSIQPYDLRYFVDPVRTQADGTFHIETLPLDEHARFEALQEGLSRAFSDSVRLEPGETTRLELPFPARRAAVLDVVSSATGAPVVGAVVTVEEHEPRARERSRAYARTDEAGHATIMPFPAAVRRVTVEANGYLPFDRRRKDGADAVFTRGEGGEGEAWAARIELEPAAWVSGCVLLPETHENEPYGPTVYLSIRALDAPGYEGYRVNDHDAMSTDACWLEAHGRFRMPVPPTGVYLLTAIFDGFEIYETASVEVAPNQVDVEVRIEIEESRRLPAEPDAWVLDIRGPDGAPVEKAEFHVELTRGSDEWRLYQGATWDEDLHQPDGTWRLPIAQDYAGIWIDIRAHDADDRAFGRTVFGPFPPGGGRRRLDLPAAGRISGRVLAPDGSPLAGAHVSAHAVASTPPPAGGRGFLAPHGEADTDADGAFRLGGLGQARYRLAVEGGGDWLPPEYCNVACGADVTLRAVAPRSAVVTVLGPEGAPLAECYVSADPRSHAPGRSAPYVGSVAETGADGRARLERLEEGAAYRLWVSGPGDEHRNHEEARWIPEDTTVRLERWWRVAGTVVDSTGAPVPRVWVNVRDGQGTWSSGKTSRKGTFSIRGLAPGPARAVATWGKADPEDLTEAHAVDVEPGTTDLVLVLRSLRDLTVEVTGLRTRRPPSFDVWVWPIDPNGDRLDDVRSARVDREPTLRIRGLEPGRPYLLWGRLSSLDRFLLAEISADATSISVPFQEGGRIDGRVLLPADATADEPVRVWLRVRGLWISADLDPGDGTFTIRAVPRGAWTVEAHRGAGETRQVVRAPARAGDRLTLDLHAR